MKYIHYLFWPVIFVLLFLLLQTQYAFHFFYIEQNQLFQNTWPYISENLFQVGGLAVVLSESLVQFFMVPYMGALITALLITLAGFLTSLIVRRIAPKVNLLVLSLLPTIALLFIQFDFNSMAFGTTAYLITILAFGLVLYITDFNKRLLAHLILTFSLFYLAGSVYVLYALVATVYELINRSSSRSYLVLLLLLEALLIGVGSVYLQVVPEYRFAFLPDSYFHTKQLPPLVVYSSWIAFVLVVLLALVLRNKAFSKKGNYTSLGAQCLLIIVLYMWGIPKYDDSKSYMLKELDYYCRTEQWDKILKRCEGNLTNYLYLCYLNVALLEKGELAERMFMYDQRGPQGIMPNWNMTIVSSTILNEIYYAINNVIPAQKLAFEANIGGVGKGNPRMLKRLIQTNLICKAYPVAEKYIRILENTYCYKDWATNHRKYLNSDEIVVFDPVLGTKHRSLLKENTLSQIEGLDMDMIRIAEQNPSDKSAIEFLGGYYLLAKDMARFNYLIEYYYGTEVLPVLPRSFQEAVIILSENEPEKWVKLGLPQQMINDFKDYKKQILAYKDNPNALPGLLKRPYGHTYWYYYMFK